MLSFDYFLGNFHRENASLFEEKSCLFRTSSFVRKIPLQGLAVKWFVCILWLHIISFIKSNSVFTNCARYTTIPTISYCPFPCTCSVVHTVRCARELAELNIFKLNYGRPLRKRIQNNLLFKKNKNGKTKMDNPCFVHLENVTCSVDPRGLFFVLLDAKLWENRAFAR